MFTGLVEEVGTLVRLARTAGGGRAVLHTTLGRREPLALGESVSVSGACLTVARVIAEGFEADVSEETLARTTLGGTSWPAPVNLERASALGARMGGHVVLGHVDGLARLTEITSGDGARRASFTADGALRPFFASKGSVAVDGVSLTINDVTDAADEVSFTVMLVPHTLGATTLSALRAGSRVNVEVDVLARYVARQLAVASPGPYRGGTHADDERILEKLRAAGFTT